MTLENMHWWRRLDALMSESDGQMQPGLALDLASAPWRSANPATLAALREQQQLAQAPKDEGRGMWGSIMHGAGEALEFGDPVFKVLGAPYKWLSTEVLSPLSHVGLVASNADHQRAIGADNRFEAMFDLETWHKAERWAEKDSVGRGITLSLMGFIDTVRGDREIGEDLSDDDLQHMENRLNSEDDWNVTSGTGDFFSTLFLDPLVVGGKIAKGARLLKTVTPASRAIQKEQDFDKILAKEPVRRFLTWTEGKNAAQIAEHPALRESPQAGLIADMLSRADVNDKTLIYRIGLGDQAAMDELSRTAPHIAAQVERMRQTHQYALKNLIPQVGLKRDELKAVKDDLKLQEANFLAKHATTLRLGETEGLIGGMPSSADPFAAAFAYKNGLREARQSHALAYSWAAADDAARGLFSTPSTLRTPTYLQTAMDDLEDLEGTARLLSDSRATQGAGPGARLGDLDDAPAARTLGDVTLYSSDELAEGAAHSGRTKGGRQLSLRFGDDPMRPTTKAQMAQMASKPDDLSEMMHRASVEGASAARYPLHNYNADDVAEYADRARGQLDYLDDFVRPEIERLDEATGHYRRMAQGADDIENLTPDVGIFRQLDVLPRGGVYARTAERGAARRYERSVRYSRGFDLTRYSESVNQVRHFGPLSRPVHYARQLPRAVSAAAVGGKVEAAFSRSNTPSIYDPNDLEAWRTLDTWLRRVKGLPGRQRSEWVSQHMGLTNEADRLAHVEQVEAGVMAHMMARQGITNSASVERVVAMTLGQRKALVGRMAAHAADGTQPAPYGSSSGVYGAGPDGLRVDALERDGAATVASPLLRSQLANKHPLLPVDDLERAFYRDRHILRNHPNIWGAHDTITESLQLTSRIWKGSVLARVGYVARTVSDESLMAMATIGGLKYLSGAMSGSGAVLGNLPTGLRNLPIRYSRRSASRRGELWDEAESLRQRPHGRGEGLADAGDGLLARGVFHGPRGPIYRSLTSTEQRGLWEVQDKALASLRSMAAWKILDPATADEATHLTGWANALNYALGKDKLARMALAGATPRQMARWLRSAEGRKYSQGNKLMRAKREDWAYAVHHLVDQYSVGNPELRAAALKGKVSTGLLKERVPVGLRPTVHGGDIDYNLGRRGFAEWTNALLDGFYHVANKLPTDALVRHPVADVLYQRRLRELVASAKAQGVNVALRPEELYRMEEVARQWTVKRMGIIYKDHLFDNPATALRFVFPFFGAWRASLARWGRAVGEDPSLIARFNQGWQGLHKPFDTVDENGVPIEDSDEKAFGLNTKNSIVVRLPDRMVKKLGIPFAPAQAIPLRSMNTVLQGDPWYNPGAGPFITVPVAKLVEGNPERAKLARELGILPFGARSTSELVLPPSVRRYMSQEAGLDDRTQALTYINIARVEMTRWQLGQRTDMPTSREIWSKTNTLAKMRWYSALLSPVSNQPVFYDKAWAEGKVTAQRIRVDGQGNPVLRADGTPVTESYVREIPKEYLFLAGKFRDYLSKDPEHGEEKFLAEFPEAFAYVESVSKNPSGIPANPQSWAKSQRMKDLYATAPDIFSSAVGIRKADRKGFDPDIYNAQFRELFDPVAGTHMREHRDPATFMTETMVAKGWRDFELLQSAVTTLMQQRGLATLDTPQGQDLKDAKAAMIKALSDQNPFWAKEYISGGDPSRMQRILEQAATIAKDKRLLADSHRSDIPLLQNYLEMRAFVQQELLARSRTEKGSADLKAKSNEDLFAAWEAAKMQMNQQNTLWAELWGNKYFANDNLQEMVR